MSALRTETAALAAWLQRLEARPGPTIRLGLERVEAVLRRLAPDLARTVTITVGGTNGKGSVVACLEAVARAAGYAVFSYTSPHLLYFAERMRLDGEPLPDEVIVGALDAVEHARGDIPLTYFEHTTLSALHLAGAVQPDLLVLEVGLGGRLDAVNCVDADVAVVTAIGLDHLEFLGPDRAAVAHEKAAIARRGRPLVVGDPDPPATLFEQAEKLGADLQLAGRDFNWAATAAGWTLTVYGQEQHLPLPALTGPHQLGNAACALVALAGLARRLPVSATAVDGGLANMILPGRFEIVPGTPDFILDVGHNAHAAEALRAQLAGRRVIALIGMLADKDVTAVAAVLDDRVSHWLAAGLDGPRGQSGQALAARLRQVPVTGAVEALKSVSRAIARARELAGPSEQVLVFGSFHTVAVAARHLRGARLTDSWRMR